MESTERRRQDSSVFTSVVDLKAVWSPSFCDVVLVAPAFDYPPSTRLQRRCCGRDWAKSTEYHS